MAAWQFDLLAVHEPGSTELPPALRLRAEKLLAEGFGAPLQVSDTWQLFGNKGGNCLELISSADGTCELWVRIDARTDAEPFLTCLVILMIEMECQLIAPELDRTFAAQMDLLKGALQASSAWQYAVSAA